MTNVICDKEGCSESFDPEVTGVETYKIIDDIPTNKYYHSVEHAE